MVSTLQATLLAAILTAAAMQSRMAQGAVGQGLLKTAWVPICGLTTELGTIANQVYRDTTTTLSDITTLKRQAIRSRIFSRIKATTKEGTAAILLAEYFDRRAFKAIDNLKSTGMHGAIDATRAASYLKGRIDETMMLLAQSSSSDNNGCLVGTAAEQRKTYSAKKIDGVGCPLEMQALEATPRTTDYLDETGCKQLKSGQETGNTYTPGAGTHKCRLLDGTANKFADTQQLTGDHTPFAGYITVTKGGGNIKLAALSDLKTAAADHIKAWKHAFDAVKKMATSQNMNADNETTELQQRSTLADAVMKLTRPNAQGTDPDLTQTMHSYFGGKEAAKLKVLTDAIDNVQIPKDIAHRTTQMRLGDISSIDELYSILSYYDRQTAQTIQDLRTQLDAANKKKDPKSAEEKEKECNAAGNSEDKCKELKEKGCTFNEQAKKCELKKDVKEKLEKENQETGGKDGKTTNTTASNSFVIHKAPLLLAFLLF
uniref:Variant surface glycoprotein 31 n=1 Tax=Trypanosoma brucei TaxID=5691 RepID=M4T1G5_9TRYP|nr:variant surface glycoprotein 31 [Trypanosoma brucei]